MSYISESQFWSNSKKQRAVDSLYYAGFNPVENDSKLYASSELAETHLRKEGFYS